MRTISTVSPSRLLSECLADAEREVSKLRSLLVAKLCNCRPLSTTYKPLEPLLHRLECEYRKALC